LTKAEEFLWIVQTVILANAVNLARLADDPRRTATFSASGTFITASEAARASRLIPADMTAEAAAEDFISYSLSNLREAEEKASGERRVVPAWYARS
jgi:hypothetical protein